MEQIKSEIRKLGTQEIADQITTLGGGRLADVEARMVRAALIDVYAERTSPTAAESLMDAIGL